MVLSLRAALGELAISPGEVMAGVYQSTDGSRCDTENRLFTNPADAIPKGVMSIRFERGVGPPPEPPVQVRSVEGHLYYYRYRQGDVWQWWEPDRFLARWSRVPRRISDDGSCRPVWLAMKQAAAAGEVEILASKLDDVTPIGVRIMVHATGRGPRSAPAVSETLIDGTIAAFHAGPADAAAVAVALASRMPSVPVDTLEALLSTNAPGALFSTPAFAVTGSYVQASPCDERCYVGEVGIRPDAVGKFVEISGEIFAVRRRL
jgi:hypothetical protein